MEDTAMVAMLMDVVDDETMRELDRMAARTLLRLQHRELLVQAIYFLDQSVSRKKLREQSDSWLEKAHQYELARAERRRAALLGRRNQAVLASYERGIEAAPAAKREQS